MKLSIDMSGFNKAIALAPDAILSEMDKGCKEGLVDIQRDARKVHKFNRRSGNLERSVQVDFVSFSDREPKGLRLESGIAPYGARIHEGYVGKTDSLGRTFKGPKPDQFLYQAAERGTGNLIKKIEAGVRRAIVKLGLS